jgi:hypothetical protein
MGMMPPKIDKWTLHEVCYQCLINGINGWVLGEVALMLRLAHEYWGPVFSSCYSFLKGA